MLLSSAFLTALFCPNSIFAPVDGMGCEQGGRSAKKEGEDEPVESEKVSPLPSCFSVFLREAETE